MIEIINSTLQIKRGLSSAWQKNNPILALPNNSENNEDSNGFSPKKSFTEMLISKITDKFAGPERQRVINDYLNDEVIPWFKKNLERMEKELIEMISENLKKDFKNDSIHCVNIKKIWI